MEECVRGKDVRKISSAQAVVSSGKVKAAGALVVSRGESGAGGGGKCSSVSGCGKV